MNRTEKFALLWCVALISLSIGAGVALAERPPKEPKPPKPEVRIAELERRLADHLTHQAIHCRDLEAHDEAITLVVTLLRSLEKRVSDLERLRVSTPPASDTYRWGPFLTEKPVRTGGRP